MSEILTMGQVCVDDRYVTSVAQLPTPVKFGEIFPPDDFPPYFYRWPKAPDLEISSEDLDIEAIRSVGVFWVTVTGLSNEPSRTASRTALSACAGRGITVLDLGYRAQFWPTREHVGHWARQALPYVSVAVGNLDERDTAVGERGALRHGLLADWDLERVMRFANAAGAIVAWRLACSDAMPTAAEVEALLNEEPRDGTHA